MRKDDLRNPASEIDQLQRDLPILIADDDLKRHFSALLDDEELEEVLQEFIAPMRGRG